MLEHEIKPGNGLGHGMLNLQAGVHLDKIELAVLVEELDGTGAPIFQLAHGSRNCLPDLQALGGIQGRRGGFFPNFLVAPLQRTITLAQMHGVTFAVAEHLNFDMARLLEIFLDVDSIVAERGLGFRPCRCQRNAHFGSRVRDFHPASAAASGRLHQHRKAHLGGNRQRFGLGRDGAIGARHARNAQSSGGILGGDLVAHNADMFGRWPDERQIVFFENLGKPRILRQESVAGMHCVRAGNFARSQQTGNIQIALGGWRRSDTHAFVGQAHMHRLGVSRGMNRDGRNAQLLASSLNSQRNLTSVGNQDFIKHVLLTR